VIVDFDGVVKRRKNKSLRAQRGNPEHPIAENSGLLRKFSPVLTAKRAMGPRGPLPRFFYFLDEESTMRKFSLLSLFLLLLVGLMAGCAQKNSLQPSGRRVIDVRLDSAGDYELAEAFGKILESAAGVTGTRMLSSQLTPDNPQASGMLWQVELASGVSPFQFQSEVMTLADRLLAAGGRTRLGQTSFDYSPSEIALLRGLRVVSATSKGVQFMIDRERARDREFSGR
jgi:hypothetical protein